MSSEEEEKQTIIDNIIEPESRMINPAEKNGTGVRVLIDMYNIFSPSNSEHQMVVYVSNYLKEKGINHTIDTMGNIYCRNHVDGGKRILLNAHMDTVASGPADIVQQKQKDGDIHIKSSNNEVIGADDKNGIFALLKLMTDKSITEPISGLICVAEENGCNGSAFAMKNHIEEFADCVFCITIDRRGNKDIITQNFDLQLCSDVLKTLLNEIGKEKGYESAEGSISDVSNIVEALDINGINLFAGYYNAHSGNEYTSVRDLASSIIFAKLLVTKLYAYFQKHDAEYIPTPAVRKWSYTPAYGGAYGMEYYGTTSAASQSHRTLGDLEKAEKLDAVVEQWLAIVDDIETLGSVWVSDELLDLDYRLSNSGKSLIIEKAWQNCSEELEYLRKHIDIRKIDNFDAGISLADIDKYQTYYAYKNGDGDYYG